MTKIVYNGTYGGFGLSDKAIDLYLQLKNIPYVRGTDGRYSYYYTYETTEQAKTGKGGRRFDDCDIPRDDVTLVAVVEQLGAEANGNSAKLKIVDLPAGTRYFIDEYDGFESVQTEDSIKWSIA